MGSRKWKGVFCNITSRIVPPPTAVNAAQTKMPKISKSFLMAKKLP